MKYDRVSALTDFAQNSNYLKFSTLNKRKDNSHTNSKFYQIVYYLDKTLLLNK